MEEKYLIESMEHTIGNNVAWWKPYHLGYTQNVNEAGRYSESEAREICEKAGPKNERMWKESDVLSGKSGDLMTVVLV